MPSRTRTTPTLPLHHAAAVDPLAPVDISTTLEESSSLPTTTTTTTTTPRLTSCTVSLSETEEYIVNKSLWSRHPCYRKKWLVGLAISVVILLVLIISLLTTTHAKQRSSIPTSSRVEIPLNYGVCRLTAIEVYVVNSTFRTTSATSALATTSDGPEADAKNVSLNQTNHDTHSFECAIVVAPIDSNPANDNDVALFVTLPSSLVQTNAASMNRKDWYIAYDPVWVQEPTDSMTVPAGTEVISMTGQQVEMVLEQRFQGAQGQRRVRGGAAVAHSDARRALNGGSASESQDPNDHFSNNGKVIIVRVTTADGVVSQTAEELYNVILGEGPVSLKAQVAHCSAGAVNLTPYDPYTPVVEITIPGKTADYYFNQIFYAANPILKKLYNVQDFWGVVSHVIFVAPSGMQSPPGSSVGAEQEVAAYAGVDHFKVIFTDTWVANVGVLLHETGHNRGLGHAWLEGSEYGDISGAMGAAVENVQYVCYNGAQNDQLQWMMDRYVVLDPHANPDTESGLVDLVAITDYAQSVAGQVVTLHVGDVWMTYNRAKSFNQDTALRQDQVVVHRRKENSSPVATELVGAIDATNQDFVVSNYYAQGVDLVVKFCRIAENPDLITLGIGTSMNGDLCAKPYIASAHHSGPSPSPPTKTPAAGSQSRAPTKSPTIPIVIPASPPPQPVPPTPGSAPTSADGTAYAQHGNNIFLPLYANGDVLPRTPGTTCEDYHNVLTLIDNIHGHKSCDWIQEHLHEPYNATGTIQQVFCVPNNDVYRFCEATCGKCVPSSTAAPPTTTHANDAVILSNLPAASPSCMDNNNAHFMYMGGDRTCEWIAARNYLWKFACEDDAVRDACQHTCQSC